MQFLPSHTIHLKGQGKYPCVVILGAVHGNERVGARVIRKLAETLPATNFNGEIYLILGNPGAYKANKRFLKVDLNRLFNKKLRELQKKPKSKLFYEENRALELAPILAKANYLLDIHSTLKPSIPFVFCQQNKKHYQLAKLFSIRYVVTHNKQIKDYELLCSTDNHVDEHGGIGLTFETGWHKDKASAQEVLKKVYRFLQRIGSVKMTKKNTCPKNSATILKIYDHLIPQAQKFKFSKNYNNFDCIKKGEVIATDNGKQIKAKKKSYIIFPKEKIIIGKAAGYLAF